MKFMSVFSIKPESKGRDEAIRRFKETGGVPPKGVTMLGRWSRADFSGGYVLMESDDPHALMEFALMWSDVMDLSIVPVIDDQGLAAVLQRRGT